MKHLTIYLFIAFFSQAYGQQNNKKYLRKAEKATGRIEYAKALEYYNKVLDSDPNSYEANAGKGMVLGEFMERYEQAIPYLEKALAKSTKDTLLTIYYTLGKCYHYQGDYNRALYCYNKLQGYEEIGNPMFAVFLRKNIADCYYGLEHKTQGKQYVQNSGPVINTPNPEYAPVIMNKNELVFTSKRKDDDKEKLNEWDGKYFESMYTSNIENGKLSTPKRFTRPDLKNDSKFPKYNESTISISLDGRSLFLYKSGDIYVVPVNDPAKKPRKLDKQINLSRYQNHAVLSKDNRTIYFSSESRKGYGGTDIFMSVKNDKDEWSEAQMLDSTINTIFNEDAPFIGEDGTLYFASNGHPGYGNYDIYKTRMENGKWRIPENMGQPVNSPGPDLFLSMVNKTEGYISSDRPGGFGDLDIYTIDFDPQLKRDSVPDPLLAIKEPKLKPEKTKDTASTNKYLSDKELKNLGWINSPLYFNYNTHTIRNDAIATLDHNIEILKSNKKLMIIINGYSDARGQERYNINLSSNRAMTVKQYIISKGIDRNRIKSTEGFGESGLLNNCGDGVECDEAQHQMNRRVEVRILNENYKPKGMVLSGQK
jgi:outer membrane protein OmpA-like peptidoglycan-associated protein/tetratricopeptide (TPR) repeat protein